MLNEICARVHRSYVHYWSTKHANGVDFVIAPPGRAPLAVECTWTARELDPAGLLAFRRRSPKGRNLLVASDVREPYVSRKGGLVVQVVGADSLAAKL